MNRRSFLTRLIAAPAVIAIDNLMPVRLWVPTIYGDAIHDDWEGLQAWMSGEKVNILPKGLSRQNYTLNLGAGRYRLSGPLHIPRNHSLIGAGPDKTILEANPNSDSYVLGFEAPFGEEIGGYAVQASDGGVSRWGTRHF